VPQPIKPWINTIGYWFWPTKFENDKIFMIIKMLIRIIIYPNKQLKKS
jgi:hypothetical protein